ncbi:DUF192 domain-containing protein [Dongia sp.]|uniref:DUF192 domain-containing protein n=1 Tax=Dongia sp. TaxID=1977262 RepID=UPI0035B41678
MLFKQMLRAIALAAAVFFVLPAAAQDQASPQVPVLIHAGGSTYKFLAEIADSGPEREQGLMFREHLDPNQGMLFLYPVAKPVAFWMKNTPLPLDMLFIADDGRILNVAPMAKPFDTSPISSKGAAIAVLEILGGSAAQLGIEAGDKVEWPAQPAPATP